MKFRKSWWNPTTESVSLEKMLSLEFKDAQRLTTSRLVPVLSVLCGSLNEERTAVLAELLGYEVVDA